MVYSHYGKLGPSWDSIQVYEAEKILYQTGIAKKRRRIQKSPHSKFELERAWHIHNLGSQNYFQWRKRPKTMQLRIKKVFPKPKRKPKY